MRRLARVTDAPPPHQLLARLPAGSEPVLLDSSSGGWSMLAWSPDRRVEMRMHPAEEVLGGTRPWPLSAEDPAKLLEEAYAGERWSLEDGLPLGGGWVGWFGFECGHAYERFPWAGDHGLGIPDGSFARYPRAMVWDPQGTAHVVHAEFPGGIPAADFLRECEAMCEAGRAAVPVTEFAVPRPAVGAEGRYQEGVRQLRAWIADGEIYQANLSHRMDCDWAGSPRHLYAELRDRQPTAMSAYWEAAGGEALVSHSPERFLRVDGELLESRPIKGTAARGADPAADLAAAAALDSSAKERAELTMIVDMARNDLGRVAVDASVEVPCLGEVERFPSLFHRTATVRARRLPEAGLAALMAATFPPASITGAPKVRALRAIAELEKVARGPYCGALGWWQPGPRPRGDFSVLIRTALVAAGRLSLSVGAGIVWDSDPAREWEETVLKGRYLVRA